MVRRLVLAVLLCLAAPAAAQPAAQPAPPTLRLQSFTVVVRDYDEARAWYAERLGFAVVRDQPFGRVGERFVMVAPPGQRDVGIVLQKAVVPGRGAEPGMADDISERVGTLVNVVLVTNDVTALADSLRARGVPLTRAPRQTPWGGEVAFRDLYGNTFVAVGPLTARVTPPARP